MCYLKDLPLIAHFSNITNIVNSKITYAKAGGTFCKTKKSKKQKSKFIVVILPSKKEIYLSKYTCGYLGKNTNFNIPKLVEGKWGFSFHNCKKIKVRGVAMNPVDHPNGGRAKTVQPERSP
jgi:ribosomal protein L2